jgi:selenocysteine lyase/cysteine desulfurase
MPGTVALEPLTDQRAKFVVDDDVAYFNTAALSPMLHSVLDAGKAALDGRSKPWTLSPPDWFTDSEELRSSVARLIGVPAGAIALIPATSYGLAVVARNLSAKPGDRVVVLDSEFPSNFYTWHRFAKRTGAELVVVKRASGQTWTDAILDAIDERVVVASVPNVHWTNGALVDLPRVAASLRDAGAALVIDASQSLGSLPLDIATLRPLAVVAVGYKWMLGPYSLGYMYLDPRLHDGEPLEENWILRAGSEDFTSLVDYHDAYRPGAERFDVGERSNFQLLPMAIAAVRQLSEWTVAQIAATLRLRTDEIVARAERLGLTALPGNLRGPNFVGIELPRERTPEIAVALAKAKVIASVRGASLRLAPHLHTNADDIDRLLEVLQSTV